jgi:hypothetical protein
MAWKKFQGIRTRPPGKWRQTGELFERFLASLPHQSYSDTFLPLVARREQGNPHDPNAVAIDAQWRERRGFWPFRRGVEDVRAQIGYVPAEIAAGIDGDQLAIDFYDYSTDHREEIAIRCLVLTPTVEAAGRR